MLTSKRSQFTLPPQVTYLNCAYMSPLMKDVEKAGIQALRRKRNPVTITPNDFFNETEILREEYAKLINVKEPQRLAIIPSVSYGMANVAKNLNLKKGQHIVVTAEQFPSNYYSWKSVADEAGASLKSIAPPEEFIDRGKKWNERILDAIDKDTRAVAIPNVHWVDGTLFDLKAIRKRSKEVGALLIIDGTQSIGALPFDQTNIQADAVICAGYKWLLGPYSIGIGYYGEYFDNGKAIEESWMNRLGSENFWDVSYKPAYKAAALRYEVGEHSNFVHMPMLIKSIQQLNKWNPERIQEYCAAITAGSVMKLKEKGFIIEDEAWRGAHMFGIRLPKGADLEKIKTTLLKHKIYVSVRSNAIRVSQNVFNSEEDLAKLTKILIKAL
jgi:selenocysteine lyase/cysteine desulfurase